MPPPFSVPDFWPMAPAIAASTQLQEAGVQIIKTQFRDSIYITMELVIRLILSNG